MNKMVIYVNDEQREISARVAGLLMKKVYFGDADPCGAESHGYFCTRRYGHAGAHIADSGTRPHAVWLDRKEC